MYEKDTKINPEALDIEWLDQPSLMRKYNKLAAQARFEMDKAQEHVLYVRAELDKKIRANPEKYDIDKVTETVISNTITLQKDYQHAQAAFYEARFEYEVAKGVVQSVEHRKSALENLVRLFGQDYFAGPVMPREISKEWEKREIEKRANRNIKGMKRENK